MSSLGAVGGFSGLSSMQGMGGARAGGMRQPLAEMREQFEKKFESAAQEAGIDVSKFKELRGQIESAVKSVAEGANGASGADLQASIEDAVNGVLKENGIDPAEFKEQMGQVFDKMGMPKPGSGGFGGPGAAQGGPRVSGSTDSTKQDLMSQLLSQLGQGKTGGLYGNLPAGSLVDEAA